MNLYKVYLSVAGIIVLGMGIKFVNQYTNPDRFFNDEPPAPSAPLEKVKASQLLKQIRSGPGLSYVNIWATWCEPCVKEIPDLVRLKKKYHQLKLFLVSADRQDEMANVSQFLIHRGVHFKTYLKTEPNEEFFKRLAPESFVVSMPVSFIFNQRGELLDYWEGLTSYTEMEEKLTTALGEI